MARNGLGLYRHKPGAGKPTLLVLQIPRRSGRLAGEIHWHARQAGKDESKGGIPGTTWSRETPKQHLDVDVERRDQ